jgi:hypothetical protein
MDFVAPILTGATGVIANQDTSLPSAAPGGLQPIGPTADSAAYSLIPPIAGAPIPPSAQASQFPTGLGGQTMQGGDDGKQLTILLTTAHTAAITVGAAGHGYVNGSKNVITFTGVIGNYVFLEAYNGVWYVLGNTGGTLSGT